MTTIRDSQKLNHKIGEFDGEFLTYYRSLQLETANKRYKIYGKQNIGTRFTAWNSNDPTQRITQYFGKTE